MRDDIMVRFKCLGPFEVNETPGLGITHKGCEYEYIGEQVAIADRSPNFERVIVKQVTIKEKKDNRR